MQIALAIRDEVIDLEKAGIRIIQNDETRGWNETKAALKEMVEAASHLRKRVKELA